MLNIVIIFSFLVLFTTANLLNFVMLAYLHQDIGFKCCKEKTTLNFTILFHKIPMNTCRNVFQRSTIAARINSKKKSRLLYNQTWAMSVHHQRTEKESFHDVLDDVIDSITKHPAVAEIPTLEDWLKKLFTHNLSGGKGARGQTVVMAYEMLESPEKVTKETMRLARILGWCVEMSYVVIMDDIMDQSTTRRGQPCWYVMPGVGTSCALNDSILVHCGMDYVLRKNFGDKTNYATMLDTLNETLLLSGFGQYLDLKTSELSSKDYITTFTAERHSAIIKYKTAYYTYDLPIYLGFLLTGNQLSLETRKQVQDLSLDLGKLFQIQDDYIDCYSDEKLTGKAGSDIQEGKCSWLAVNALQRCNKQDRIVFNSCYGSKEPAHIERIKNLYDKLKLPELYKEVERSHYDGILEKIKDLPSEEWKRLFHRMLGITYQRKK